MNEFIKISLKYKSSFDIYVFQMIQSCPSYVTDLTFNVKVSVQNNCEVPDLLTVFQRQSVNTFPLILGPTKGILFLPQKETKRLRIIFIID